MKFLPVAVLFVPLVILPTGSDVKAQWIPNGVPVIATSNDQEFPRLASDDSGGVICVWVDSRHEGKDLYGQRIDANGDLLWAPSGVQICVAAGDQMLPQILTDMAGGAIVVWEDHRDNLGTDLYAQRVDANGSILWSTDGVPVCDAPRDQSDPRAVGDGSGGAIIAWADRRGGSDRDIYAQRIDAGGHRLWASGGVPVCTAIDDQTDPELIHDGFGGALIVWRDRRVGYPSLPGDLYAQRVDADGVAQWSSNGNVVENEDKLVSDHVVLVRDGAGGAIIAWRIVSLKDGWPFVTSVHLDSTGGSSWWVAGSQDAVMSFRAVPDAQGGAMLTWSDAVSRDGGGLIAIQGLSHQGESLWSRSVDVVSEGGFEPRILWLGEGKSMVAWEDDRNGIDHDVYAQKIARSGATLWTVGGKAICTATGDQTNCQIVSDGVGGAFIAWVDRRNGVDADIYAQRVNGFGDPVPALLRSFEVRLDPPAIVVEWVISETGYDAEFVVWRARLPDGDFVELPSIEIVRRGPAFAFSDDSYSPGSSYRYRVAMVDGSGTRSLFETEPVATFVPELVLVQNHPNPFKPSTSIEYALPEPMEVALSVYDVEGRLVVTLDRGMQSEGSHEAQWDGRDANGQPVSAGIYFYTLHAGGESLTKKMLLLR